LWTDWNLADEDSDGGSSTSNVGSEGTYNVNWGSIQDSAAPSITVELPGSTDVEGTYRITVSGTNGSESRKTPQTYRSNSRYRHDRVTSYTTLACCY